MISNSAINSSTDPSFRIYYDLMSKRVSEILLVSSPYDAFIIEEDQPLTERIIDEYKGLNLTRPPRVTWASNAKEALDKLSRRKFDLILTMPNLGGMECHQFGKMVKEMYGNLPVFLLTHTMGIFRNNQKILDKTAIDRIILWTGNPYLLVALIKNVEDQMNVAEDTMNAKVRVIILVEDTPMYCSLLLPLLYQEVVSQTQRIMEESVNEEHRILKMRARPKILLAETYEEAEKLYKNFRPYVLGVFSDVRFPKDGEIDPEAGFKLLSMIRSENSDLPLLMLSSEEINREKALRIPAVFVNKNSLSIHADIRDFLVQYLGFGDFIFRLPNGKPVARASNIREMETILPTVPDESVYYHATHNHFSSWLMARAEIQLALQLKPIKATEFQTGKEIKDFLISCLKERRRYRKKGIVAAFSREDFDPDADFVKIGRGSLGGKARGLAFVSNQLKKFLPDFEKKFPTVHIYVPKTLVISTEGFDAFMQVNGFDSKMLSEFSDAAILNLFQSSIFPAWLIQDLEAFLTHVHYPLAVRSSSLMEDAQYQAYAGMYQTCMIPNNHPNPAIRMNQLLDGIRLVYASTFLEKPRSFTKRIPFRREEEKMAVIIQQLTGNPYNGVFYPAISGVAQSWNYYPISPMKPTDGIVHMSLGLGRIVVEGGKSLRFCPAYPAILPQFSTVDDILKNAQRSFYALKMKDYPDRFGLQDTASLVKYTVDDPAVAHHYPIQFLSSVYVPEEHRIRDSFQMTGHKVLTFSNIIKYHVFPLPEVISTVLDAGQEGMGCPVEIEFAVNFSSHTNNSSIVSQNQQPNVVEFAILQIRPMALNLQNTDIEIQDQEMASAFCRTYRALGNGIFSDIADIVFVKPTSFDPMRTVDIASQIGKVNGLLMRDHRKYLLIGPGRWGTADRFLGIPVTWNDISFVGAMVEFSIKNLNADPSQGSHFFNNITSLGIPYLTISSDEKDYLDTNWLDSLPTIQETEFIKHIRLSSPLTIKVDGKNSKACIFWNSSTY